ncbi:MAG TPA: hypothetical protein VLB47_10970, partial [Solirubrobacteraceae bacterium]|nr:hypothetical protein [Solirubrobacteraceae bacterium]
SAAAPRPARARGVLQRALRGGPSGAAGDDDGEVLAPGRSARPGARAPMARHGLRLDLELRTRRIDSHLYGRAPPTHIQHEE